jgi:5'-nucleotidase
MDLTGADIEAALERQWEGQPYPRVLQISGITYSWNPAAPAGSRVDPASVAVNGAPLNLAATYTVTVNSFLADGGDNFTMLKNGTDRVVGPVDLQALIDYVKAMPQPFNQTIVGRITTL